MEAEMDVRFDWSEVEGTKPSSMSLYLFNSANSMIPVSFPNASGGAVRIMADRYQALAYNSDTETFQSAGDSWTNFELQVSETSLEAYTRMFATTRSVPRAEDTDEEPVIHEPDQLWTGATGQHDFRALGDDMVLTMHEATCEFHLTIHNVENSKYVTGIAATVSGMSSSFIPSKGKPSQTASIICIPLTQTDETTLQGSVRCLGHCPEQLQSHKLVVYAMMETGQRYYYTIDISDLMHPGGKSGGNVDVDIDIDKLPLPQPILDDGGLHPEVDEWSEITVPVEM